MCARQRPLWTRNAPCYSDETPACEEPLHIGACRLTYRLPGNESLKGKRQISRSLIARLRQRFNLAVAEVDGLDRHRTLVIGMACVSNEAAHASEMLDAAIRFAGSSHLDLELVDVERELIDGV